MIIDEEVYLEHFGVKGMRWGQRRSRSQRKSENSSFAQRVRTDPQTRRRAIRGAKIAGGILAAGIAAAGIANSGSARSGVEIVNTQFRDSSLVNMTTHSLGQATRSVIDVTFREN
jgi:hypothetical protein